MSEQQQPIFNVDKVYLKGASLEVPNAPQVFTEQQAPTVDIKLHNEANVIGDGVYEVVLTATVTAKHGDKTAFLVEVNQAGIFQARNFTQADIDQIMNATCPMNLLPYAREAVSNLLSHAGFPVVQLPHVAFQAIYNQRLQDAQQGQQPPSGAFAPEFKSL